MKVFIESEQAQLQAQKLVSSLQMEASVSKPEATRSIDPTAIIEILKIVAQSAEIVGGLVTTAHQIWKWRQELKKADRVVLSKEDKGEEKRLLLDKDTSQKEIEAFLK